MAGLLDEWVKHTNGNRTFYRLQLKVCSASLPMLNSMVGVAQVTTPRRHYSHQLLDGGAQKRKEVQVQYRPSLAVLALTDAAWFDNYWNQLTAGAAGAGLLG